LTKEFESLKSLDSALRFNRLSFSRHVDRVEGVDRVGVVNDEEDKASWLFVRPERNDPGKTRGHCTIWLLAPTITNAVAGFGHAVATVAPAQRRSE
jgi:hypothetical protein